MAKPSSLLGDVRGFARDYPRDKMPEGIVWDLADYVPVLLDAQLTGRGGWKWASDPLGAPINGGIHADYNSGSRIFFLTTRLQEINPTTGAATDRGAVPQVKQNPVMHIDRVIIPDGTGAAFPSVVSATSSAVTIGALPATAQKARYASVYKDRVLLGNAPGNESRVWFSPVGDPTAAWDANAWQDTDRPITGLGALRAVILVFHEGSVTRIRGSSPPSTASGSAGDLSAEPLFERAGCGDAKSIAYWNDNCIFADERGVHLTDGAIVRNLITQGGLLIFWRALYRNRVSLAAETYLDYYIITVVRSDGIAVTLLCDLNRRTWFRFTNLKVGCFVHSVGTQENLWAGITPENRVASLAECFFPLTTVVAQDANGVNVLPLLETPWYRIAAEGRKRARFVYSSYDVRVPPAETSSHWRKTMQLEPISEQGVAPMAAGDVLSVGYITSPQELAYQAAGELPPSDRYTRYRLPVGKHPYGIAFRVQQILPSVVTRFYDLALEAAPEESSRV